MSEDREEYCAYENAFFPASQFADEAGWGRVHTVEPRHTTMGTIIAAGSRGGGGGGGSRAWRDRDELNVCYSPAE